MEFLKGKIIFLNEKHLILETQFGDGKRVFIREGDEYFLNQETKIFIHRNISIDGNQITEKKYGFINPNHLEFFLFLLKVEGIGCKSAMSIMSCPPKKIIKALLDESILELVSLIGYSRNTEKLLDFSQKPTSKKFLQILGKKTEIGKNNREFEILKICEDLNIDLERCKEQLKKMEKLEEKSDGEIVKEIIEKINNDE